MCKKSRSAIRTRGAAISCALLLCLPVMAGCGTQQELSAAEVDAALVQLDAVEQAIDDGDCDRARSGAQSLSDLALTAGGSQSFRDAYRESVDRLEELVDQECESAPTAATGSTGPTEAPTPTTGTTGGGTPPPDDNPGDDGLDPQPPADTPPDTPPQDTPPDDGGVGNPDSGGVRPQ